MSKSKTISIAFDTIGRIPAGILKDGKPAIVDPHKAIDVPRIYGEHLIGNHLAYDPDERARADKNAADLLKARSEKEAKDTALKTRLSELEREIANKTADIKALTSKVRESEKITSKLQSQLEEARRKIPALEAPSVESADVEQRE